MEARVRARSESSVASGTTGFLQAGDVASFILRKGLRGCTRGKALRNRVCYLGRLARFTTGTFQSAELRQGVSGCVFKGVCEVRGALSFPFPSAQLVTQP